MLRREIRNYLLIIFFVPIMGVLNRQRCKSTSLDHSDKFPQVPCLYHVLAPIGN